MNPIRLEHHANGITLVKVDNALATAIISLYGGQIIEWHPKAQAMPVLWFNPEAVFESGTPIRAGVPICWPWFGPHATDPTANSHGYARLCQWTLTSVSTIDNGATELVLTMSDDTSRQSGEGVRATLQQRITIGDSMTIDLTTTNTGDQDILFTEALHAYFKISDIEQISITGLSGCDYSDTAAGGRRAKQSGAITFSDRLDRVYLNTPSECMVRDPGLERCIKITKTGSLSTVVWNPWLETATKIKDLGAEHWREMVCVESANALDNAVQLSAGQQHEISVIYIVETI